jgi:hypothetical protein
MMSRTAFCSAQPATIFPARIADARDFPHPFGLRLYDLEGLLAERRDNPLRKHRADAAHHAGAEVFLDALGGRRRRGPEEIRVELEPVRDAR